MLVHEVNAAQYRIEPSILASEEYNDNVFLTPENREYDYITGVTPGVHFTYNAALWDWDVAFYYKYLYYARTTPQNGEHHLDLPSINVTNLTRIIEDYFFLALNDVYENTSLDIAKDYTKQSYFINTTEQNIGSVNPYVVLHPGARTTIDVGYIYQNVWYKDPQAIDKVYNIGYGEVAHELTSKLSTTIGFRYTQDRNRVQNFNSIKAYMGMNYKPVEGSNLYGTIGYIWADAENADNMTQAALENPGRVTQPTWEAGYNHKFPKFSFSFETGLIYVEDPSRVVIRQDRYIATIRREIERTTYSVYAALYEYRNAVTKHLENSSYNVGGMLTHQITTNSKISVNLSYQRVEDNVNDTYTEIFLNGGRYEYLLRENLTLALEYWYTNSYSPDIYANDYYNNRLIAEVKWVF